MRAKGCHSLIGLTLKIESPGFISACDSFLSSLNGNIIFTFDRLAIKDEEGNGSISFPAVKVVLDVRLNAGQTAKGREKRFMIGSVVEEKLQVVGRIDGDSAILELGNLGGPDSYSLAL